jgi:hypothetical protein
MFLDLRVACDTFYLTDRLSHAYKFSERDRCLAHLFFFRLSARNVIEREREREVYDNQIYD